MKKITSVVMLVLIGCTTYACLNSKDRGDRDKIKVVRNFHEAINKSDYVTAVKFLCLAQKPIKQGKFGVGPDEIMMVQSRFPWQGLELTQVTEQAGFYELKFKGASGTSVKNIVVGKEEGVDCINTGN